MENKPKISQSDLYYFMDSQKKSQKDVLADESILSRFMKMRLKLCELTKEEALRVLEICESLISQKIQDASRTKTGEDDDANQLTHELYNLRPVNSNFAEKKVA